MPYHGPKLRRTRSLQAPIAETPKHIDLRRPHPPGARRRRRAAHTLYGNQLREKQRIACYYDIRNSQLRRYVTQAQASSAPTEEVLLQILETRLDNCIRRLRWARTIWQARQLVSHGHFLVNNRKVNLPSYHVKPTDIISVRPKSHSFITHIAQSTEGMGFRIPDWLSLDQDNLKVAVLTVPDPDEILLPFDFDLSKVIEFYTR